MLLVQRCPAWRHGRFVVASVIALLCVAGCSSFDVTDKIDYRTAAPPKPLDIPPDLSQLPKDDRYQVPSASASASAQKPPQPAAAPGTTASTAPAVPAVQVARFERDGSQRWLAVDLPP
jgi:outer membrane protein assembly factor BamC